MNTEPTPANLSEAERFQIALIGMDRLTVAAERAADIQTTEAATLAALTLRRRTEKARRLFEEYVCTVEAITERRTAVDSATTAYELEVDRNVEKVAKILPEIPRDEARRLITKYVPMVEARRVLNEANETAAKLSTEKLRLCRELWSLFESTALSYCGGTDAFQALLDKGKGVE